MPLEIDPPDLRLAPCCKDGHANLHIVRDTHGAVTVERWRGSDRVHDIRRWLQCGMPLRVVPG